MPVFCVERVRSVSELFHLLSYFVFCSISARIEVPEAEGRHSLSAACRKVRDRFDCRIEEGEEMQESV